MQDHKRTVVRRVIRCLWWSGLCSALVCYYLWQYYHTPTGYHAEPLTFDLVPGSSVTQIASQLHRAGLIRHRHMFILYTMLTRTTSRLQAGEYTLRSTMSPAQILKMFYYGKVIQYSLTIPEGATVRDIARLTMAQDMGTEQMVLGLAHDPSFIRALGLSTSSLEGYLFPETYYFSRHTDARAMLARMVRTYHQYYTAEIARQAQHFGLSQHEVVTLASLIEKEAKVDAERPLIAAVFHNRLRRGMRLQCDSTVIYALGERFDGNLRKADLQFDSPYNTYLYAGLPPGPIANPGQRSLQAAVTPAPVDYLYFVATKQAGTHQFSRTLREHNRAVQRYQAAD